jgi:hypothetical protein
MREVIDVDLVEETLNPSVLGIYEIGFGIQCLK